MTEEAFCSNDVVKLLHKKGFDGYCTPYSTMIVGGTVPQSVAMKWLREQHNIDIEIHSEVGMLGVKVYVPFISTYKSTDDNGHLTQRKRGLYFKNDNCAIPALQHFETNEEAVETALKYVLENLI